MKTLRAIRHRRSVTTRWMTGCLLATLLHLALEARGGAALLTYDPPGNLTGIIPAAGGAPAITGQPVDQVIAENGTAYFSVTAGGSGPFTYQWLSNGVPIAGATGDTLAVTNVIVPVNLVSNGGFELPLLLNAYVTYPIGSAINGWTIESGTADLVRASYWDPFSGVQSLDLSGTSAGTIYQDVPTVPGQSYYLDFAQAGNNGGAPIIKTNQVWWNGALLDTVAFNTTGHSANAMGWTNREYVVMATNSTTRLRFVSLANGSSGPALDEISLLPVPPPPANYSVIVSNTSGSVTSAVATIQFDADQNGLPDSWERTYFASLGQSAEADSDGDGISNGDEYREGTNPADAASFRPRLNFFIRPGGAVFKTPFKPSYGLGENVQISAAPDFGNFFLGWIGGLTDTNATVNLTMDGTKNITALFAVGLVSGANQDGTLISGDTNTYAFNGNAGDRILLRVGELLDGGGFDPKIQLFSPTGVLLGSASGYAAAELTATLTNSGLFVVVISDGTANGTAGSGDYRLNFVKLPGTFVVPAGDEGGIIVNGGNADGTITVGDLDLWTFTANAGDRIVLRVGEMTDNNGDFDPWIRLYSPSGVLLDSQSSYAAAEIAVTATSGTFTVVVADAGDAAPYYLSDTGTYRLHLAKSPGAFVVPAGDDGGALVNGGTGTGTIDTGDLDQWSFTANAGDNLVVRVGELTQDNPDFDPWIRLYNPSGVLVGSAYSYAAAEIAVTATNSGTYTIIVGDTGYSSPYYISDTGTYQISLIKAPGAFITPPGDEGGNLDNGGTGAGTITTGDLDTWSFTATNGDSIVLRVGQVTDDNNHFDPWIRLYSPTGVLLGSAYGYVAAEITAKATNSGTFTVVVADTGYSSPYLLSDTGTYQLRLAKLPGAFVVPVGDDGGTLINGGNTTGTIDTGDLDLWSFSANTGDSLLLRVGQVTDDNGDFDPGIRLYGPTGLLLDTRSGVAATEIAVTATNSGTFTVVVGDDDISSPYYLSDTGTYRLYFAKVPGAFVVGDEGAVMAPAGIYYGTNDVGDLDMWGFWANKSNVISVQIDQLTDDTGRFDPWIRLYGPGGNLLNSVSGTTTATINRLATNSGPYVVVVSDGILSSPYYYSDTGTYRLTLAGITGPVQFTNIQFAGSQLILSGTAGPTNLPYVLIMSTNIGPPVASWTPVQTNTFDSLGQFKTTNNVSPGVQSQFYQIRFQ